MVARNLPGSDNSFFNISIFFLLFSLPINLSLLSFKDIRAISEAAKIRSALSEVLKPESQQTIKIILHKINKTKKEHNKPCLRFTPALL